MSNENLFNKSREAIRKQRALVGDKPVETNDQGRRVWRSYEEYMRDQKKIADQMKAKPAISCELCGYPMDYKGHKLTKWERDWSVHEVCKAKLGNLLDRQSGAARDRRMRR